MTNDPIADSAANGWFVRRNDNLPARLFCLPYAGGSASLFVRWRVPLSPLVEVCPVELPGRGGRLFEQPFTRMQPLVEALAEATLPLLDRPYSLFGHSNGALIAFELARHLRRSGAAQPCLLIVSASRAPHFPSHTPGLHDLPRAEFLEGVRRLNGAAQEVFDNSELMDLLIPVLRADLAVNETYEYRIQDPLDCPIIVYAGNQDDTVTPDEFTGWRACTRAGFRLQWFQADHFSLLRQPQRVITHLSRDLKDAFTLCAGTGATVPFARPAHSDGPLSVE